MPRPGVARITARMRARLAAGHRLACPMCGERTVIRSYGDGQVREPTRTGWAGITLAELPEPRIDPEAWRRITLYCNSPDCDVREFTVIVHRGDPT